MTGTAYTEAGEFAHTYDLQVVPIPTNRPMVRIDNADFIYKTEDAKYDAAIDDIAERHEKGQPVLVGTISVEKSEKLSRLLEKRGIPHEVLNAKQHEREAEIVAQAGQLVGGHRRHQHGRPRRRHPARRQPRGPRPPRVHAARASSSARPSTTPATPSCCPSFKDECKVEGDKVRDARRPLRARHRTPRVAPHRQPAARPRRPPGRPGREPLLPLARRRADAAVRDRAHAARDGQVVPRRHAARVEDGLEGGRARAGHRRGPQLRDPQGRAQVRRGDERAAQDHLPAPPADPRRRRPRATTRSTRSSRTIGRLVDQYCRGEFVEEWDVDGLLDDARDATSRRASPRSSSTSCRRRAGARGAAPRRRDRALRGEGRVDRRGHAARHRAPRDALGDRPALARAPLRDGLPPGGHQPAGHGPAGPALGVAARGLRHVRGDDGPDRGRLRPVRVPPAGRGRRRARRPTMRNVQYSAPERPGAGLELDRERRWRPRPRRSPMGDRRRRRRPMAVGDRGRCSSSRCGSRRRPGRNEPCFCGSGKKYKLCHGR